MLKITLPLVILCFLTACTTAPTPRPTPMIFAPTYTPDPLAPTPTDTWAALKQRTPFPYKMPLPAPTSSPLDGTYLKIDPREGTPVPCRRCADYRSQGGLWRLQFDNGIYRIYQFPTHWRSLASFRFTPDEIEVFNDPTCLDVIGRYIWQFEQNQLQLQVIEDTCAAGRRAQVLTTTPWRACQPHHREAAVTDHWPKPSDCD